MLLNDLRLRALEPFVLDYAAALTGTTIAKRLGLNQKSVATALAQLEADGFLKSAASGKNRLFSLNLDDAAMIAHFLAALEHLRTIRFFEKHPLVKEIATKLPCSGSVLIFGSYAKGTETADSDLDLFVAGSCDRAAASRLSEAYHLPISIKAYPPAAFASALRRGDILLNEVRKSHIVLSGAQAFATTILRSVHGKD